MKAMQKQNANGQTQKMVYLEGLKTKNKKLIFTSSKNIFKHF